MHGSWKPYGIKNQQGSKDEKMSIFRTKEGAAGIVQVVVSVQELQSEEDKDGRAEADDHRLHGAAEEGDGAVGDEGAHDGRDHLADMDGVAVPAVVEDEAGGAAPEGADHGEDRPLG